MKKDNKKKGFTLIEVILAVAIISIAMIPLLGSFITASRLNVKGRQKEQAMTIAQNVMEGVKACGVENSYLWATGAGTGYSVLPSNADGTALTVSGVEANTTGVYDLSDVTVAGGGTLGDEYKTSSVTTKNYTINIDGILMGKTKYDAVLVIKQDTANKDYLAALAMEQKFKSQVGGLQVMKYYDVEIRVYNDGVAKTDDNHLALYAGTVISKGAVSAPAETVPGTEAPVE